MPEGHVPHSSAVLEQHAHGAGCLNGQGCRARASGLELPHDWWVRGVAVGPSEGPRCVDTPRPYAHTNLVLEQTV